MKIRQGFKFRLEPTPEQRQLFARFAGSCRFVYNKLLSLNDERYQDARFALNTPKIPEYVGHGLLKLWKQSDEYGWLRETYSQCLQQAVKDLERAYTNLFEGRADEVIHLWDILYAQLSLHGLAVWRHGECVVGAAGIFHRENCQPR